MVPAVFVYEVKPGMQYELPDDPDTVIPAPPTQLPADTSWWHGSEKLINQRNTPCLVRQLMLQQRWRHLAATATTAVAS